MATTRLRSDTQAASIDLAAVRDELLDIAARLDAALEKLGDRADGALVDHELQKLSSGGNDSTAKDPGSDAALVAQEIAMAGKSRDQARARLREIFGDVDVEALLDGVYLRPS